jgi:transcriptional regulator with XRE-family HTH domain
MEIQKTSEKLLIWMHRNNITQLELANKMDITRQSLSKKIKENVFMVADIIKLKSLGFKG